MIDACSSKDLQKLLTLTKLDLDVERICIYLQDDIESSVDPVDQRLLVAEVNLIERQLAAIVGNIQLSDRVDLLMKSVFEGEYDKIYENSLKETNPEKSKLIYSRLDSIISSKSIIVPLFYDEVIRFVSKNVVGMEINATNLLDLRRVKKNN